MKHITVLICGFALTAMSGFAQQDSASIAQKTQELAEAKVALSQAQAAVDQISRELKSMQPVTKWKSGRVVSLNFNQGAFTNWSLGG